MSGRVVVLVIEEGRGISEDDVPRRPDRVGSLLHGLQILDMFADDTPVVTVAHIARHIGVHRSNASRLAATLHEAGYLARGPVLGSYLLGPRLVRLGHLAGENLDVIAQATTALAAVVADAGETGHIGVLEGHEVVTVAVVDGWHTVRMHGQVSKRVPAHCSAIGKALLSALDDDSLRRTFHGRPLESRTPNTLATMEDLTRELTTIRSAGAAVDHEELELGLRCVAVPIIDARGAVVASMGLSGPAARMTDDLVTTLATRLTEAAAVVHQRIGGEPEAGR